MELNELIELADAVEQAKLAELQARRELIDAKETVIAVTAYTLVSAYEAGAIAGKNAETRKRQELAYLIERDDYIEASMNEGDAQRNADVATATLAGIETRASLIKAWLYSQTKIG